MTTEKFNMLIRVPTTLVGPVFELITHQGEGEVLEVRPAQLPVKPRQRFHRIHRNGQIPTERTAMRGIDLILDVMSGGHDWPHDRLKQAFVEAGKAPNSMSPCLSKRLADGSIVKVRQGVYRIAPARP